MVCLRIFLIFSTRLYNLQTSHHAGVAPSDMMARATAYVVPVCAYTAALKEYEDDSNTDSEGDMRVM
jgi:hypothetical protein